MTRKYACGILHIPVDAPLEEIKRAYRIMAKKLHPDQNPDLRAGERFERLRECYEYLRHSDSVEKRRIWEAKQSMTRQKRKNKGLLFAGIVILFIIFRKPIIDSFQNSMGYANTIISIPAKPDFNEGQGVDANGNGMADFVVRKGRFIGTVSGKDFGPATLENLNTRKTPAPVTPKPVPIKPVQTKPAAIPAAAASIHYASYNNFSRYAYYPVNDFLNATGWSLTSNRSHELPEDLKNKIRAIGDYLHDHYTYGSYKSSRNGIGQDDDNIFDCDDYAGLMYQMGREAGLEMYIINLPNHWANAVRYKNTLYTVEPQGVTVKYRNTSKFGSITIAEYAKYAQEIVVEK
jgi:curved DNA-binding protein CbpA